MEVWALILSIIAIVVSLLEIYHNAKMNKTNLKSEYFSELYKDYLFKELPRARNQIQVVNGKFIGFEFLQDAITNMVYISGFFKYADERFYNKLKKQCFDLEDYLLKSGNKKNVDLSTISSEIDKKLKKIYIHINKKHEMG